MYFLKQLIICWRNYDWLYKISFGLFPKRMLIEFAIPKTPIPKFQDRSEQKLSREEKLTKFARYFWRELVLVK